MSTAAIHTKRPITATDRLGVTLFLAIAFHAFIILASGFTPFKKDPPEETLPTIEVTLVNTRSDTKPDEADYLAQSDQDGGGNTEEKVQPQAPPLATPDVMPTPGNSMATSMPQPEQQIEKREQRRDVLTITESFQKMNTGEDRPNEQSQAPSAAELMQRSLEMAELEAELAEKVKIHSKDKLRHKFLQPKTMSHVEAAYLDAWRRKVETIGELNYPKDKNQRHLSGSLTMTVSINADGTLHSVNIIRPSGRKALDDAAIRIVKLAAPFAAFPEDIRRTTDILTIPRVWRFKGGSTRVSAN